MNFTSSAVLVLEGQELFGGMQNRVVNITVLAPPMCTTILPVSCSEAARWGPATTEFHVAPHLYFASGRAQCAAQVTESMIADGIVAGDQVDIWSAIDDLACKLNVRSETRAHAAVFVKHNQKIVPYETALTQSLGQCGAIYAIGERLVGMDLFDRPATTGECLGKLIQSAAPEALLAKSEAAPPATEVAGFLRRIGAARTHSFHGVGLGNDVRLLGPRLAGGALIHAGRIVHLRAFNLFTNSHPDV
jgi:hypothetical protein